MSKELVARIRRNREITVAVGKFRFTAMRPTDVEMVGLHRGDAAFSEIAQKFVTGWSGVTEDDVVGGGTADEIPFNADLWTEWCADRPDFWALISNAVLDAYRAHAEKLAGAEKN